MQWVRSLRVLPAAMIAIALFVGACIYVLTPSSAGAAQSSSTNYSVDEAFFGTGGELNACSTSYCAKQAAGETGIGNTSSTNYSAQAGFNTDRQPSLTFIVSGSDADLGILSTISTATASGTFSVKSYLSGGYVVQLASDPPTTQGPNAHTLSAPATPTASSPGTEQFGMNLAANTSPITFGADPVQVPYSTFSFGTVSPGYNTPNLYKYVKGDTIASSAKSSGQTDYTVSYIYNTASLTPSGEYRFNQILVATGTF